MNLPHLAPIKFAKKVLSVSKNKALVMCEFPYFPSLAMFCEAAAQSSSCFSKNDKKEIAYLITLKNVLQNKELEENTCFIKIEKNVEIGKMSEYYFEAVFNDIVYASGTFTIVLQ